MTTQTGVWIDHREAIVVQLSASGDKTVRVDSEFESQPRRSSDHPSGKFESLRVPSDDTRERKKLADLSHFYDAVVSHINNTSALYIFGPGEAKTELKKHLEEKNVKSASCVVETSDKLTEPQIVAKVSAHFRTR